MCAVFLLCLFLLLPGAYRDVRNLYRVRHDLAVLLDTYPQAVAEGREENWNREFRAFIEAYCWRVIESPDFATMSGGLAALSTAAFLLRLMPRYRLAWRSYKTYISGLSSS